MSIRTLLLSLLLVALSSPAIAGTVLIVGDSLSAAYGMPVEQGWVALLQKRLASEQPGWQIVNSSISGDTTANARARLPQAMQRHQPEVVVLELGGNDGLRGLSLERMKANLADMIAMIHDNSARVLLIGVQLPPNYGPVYTSRFHAIYRELAEEYDVVLLPSMVEGVGTRSDLMQGDGIHPNVRAQPMIAERIWQRLEPLILGVSPAVNAADAR